jgi:ketosteroid isomerase-like protein
MRTILLSLVICLSLIAASPDEQQILDAEKAWATAVVKKDFTKLEGMLAPDLIYAHSTGNIEDKSQYLGKMKAGAQRYDGIEHTGTTVRIYGGDAAVAHSKVRMHGKNADGPFDHRLMMIHMWVKQGNQWKLAGHQTTRLTN